MDTLMERHVVADLAALTVKKVVDMMVENMEISLVVM